LGSAGVWQKATDRNWAAAPVPRLLHRSPLALPRPCAADLEGPLCLSTITCCWGAGHPNCRQGLPSLATRPSQT